MPLISLPPLGRITRTRHIISNLLMLRPDLRLPVSHPFRASELQASHVRIAIRLVLHPCVPISPFGLPPPTRYSHCPSLPFARLIHPPVIPARISHTEQPSHLLQFRTPRLPHRASLLGTHSYIFQIPFSPCRASVKYITSSHPSRFNPSEPANPPYSPFETFVFSHPLGWFRRAQTVSHP